MHVTAVVRLESPVKDTKNVFFFLVVEILVVVFFMVENRGLWAKIYVRATATAITITTATATACTQDFDLEKKKSCVSHEVDLGARWPQTRVRWFVWWAVIGRIGVGGGGYKAPPRV